MYSFSTDKYSYASASKDLIRQPLMRHAPVFAGLLNEFLDGNEAAASDPQLPGSGCLLPAKWMWPVHPRTVAIGNERRINGMLFPSKFFLRSFPAAFPPSHSPALSLLGGDSRPLSLSAIFMPFFPPGPIPALSRPRYGLVFVTSGLFVDN